MYEDALSNRSKRVWLVTGMVTKGHRRFVVSRRKEHELHFGFDLSDNALNHSLGLHLLPQSTGWCAQSPLNVIAVATCDCHGRVVRKTFLSRFGGEVTVIRTQTRCFGSGDFGWKKKRRSSPRQRARLGAEAFDHRRQNAAATSSWLRARRFTRNCY